MSPRQLTWHRLLPGVITMSVIVVGALAILAFARVGELHGKTYRLYVVADEASGIIDGTDVWLMGRKVGQVRGISFLPPGRDSTAHLLVGLDILSSYRRYIRRDSRAEFRSGGQLVGAQVVYLYMGTNRASEARDGDTLARAQQVDPDGFANAMSRAGEDLPQILRNVRDIGDAFSRSAMRVDALQGHHISGLSLVVERADSLERRLSQGHGTFSLLVGDHTLGDRLSRAERSADSLMRLVRRGDGIVGRLQSDDTLATRLRDVRAALGEIRMEMRSGSGTIGRAASDSAIAWRLGDVERQLSLTMRDMKRHPGRYLPF